MTNYRRNRIAHLKRLVERLDAQLDRWGRPGLAVTPSGLNVQSRRLALYGDARARVVRMLRAA